MARIFQSIRNKPTKDLTFWEQAVLNIQTTRCARCGYLDLSAAINEADQLVADLDTYQKAYNNGQENKNPNQQK